MAAPGVARHRRADRRSRPGEHDEVVALDTYARADAVRHGCGLEEREPHVGCEGGGGRHGTAVGGADPVRGDGLATGIGEQHGVHLDRVQRRAGGILEPLLEHGKVDAALDDELGLLEHLAAGSLERALTRLDAPAGQRPVAQRWRLGALDPDVPGRAAENAECDTRDAHGRHRSDPRSRW